MAGYHTPIGGEFWFSKDIINDDMQHIADEDVWLDGGISAINLIVKQLTFVKEQVLLVPKYICPTVIESLKNNTIQLVFYNIKKDLSIDLQDVYDKVSQYSVRALLFVNYFGFFHSKEEKETLIALKQKNIVLIEDAVQMLWINKSENFIGDYIFNSFRKFIPYDGSLVIGRHASNMHIECETHQITEYELLMKKARIVKTNYINEHIGSEMDYLEIFEAAHKAYYTNKTIQIIEEHNKQKIMQLDMTKIKKITHQNYNYLYRRLKEYPKIICLFNSNELIDNIPVTFPILVNHRDEIRREMRQYDIYCPVHWDIRDEAWIEGSTPEVELASTILGLPIDWRYNVQDMEYIAHCLIKVMKIKP